ncbi:hypothetical protein P7K49_010545 [Saguinus oedipus]|uniref:IF rod domain-containing protein n=1 Tax=Saguinus oedipus TaxID=9490 RepID=A0ABQ9VPH3_SAGOE|nr:hypothetical protein P7K49_010545 [Saguinus oedipus]
MHQLERENAELETKLRERSKCHESSVCPDYQPYFHTIEELQQKVRYETEHWLHQLVEADICGLRRVLDNLTLAKRDLEAQLESLKEEPLCLKKNHEQEAHTRRGQLGDKLWIKLDIKPTTDLSRVLGEMRGQYEATVETNHQDVERWFQAQVRGPAELWGLASIWAGRWLCLSVLQSEGISLQAMSSSEELQCCQLEILELRCSGNDLEVELQA